MYVYVYIYRVNVYLEGMRGVFVVKKGMVSLKGKRDGPASPPAISGAEGSFSTLLIMMMMMFS
jgi:hypothetical protein